MLDFISRVKLERRGLSSGKRRRKVQESGFLVALEGGNWAKVAVFVLFAAATTLFILVGRETDALFSANRLQAVLMISGIIVSLVIHFLVNHTASFERNGRVLLTLGTIFIHLLFLKLAFLPVQRGIAAEDFKYLLPPYALGPMALSILLGRNHGTLGAIYVSLLGGLLVSADKAFEFTVLSLVAGFVGVYLTHNLRRRGQIITAGFLVGLATTVLAISTGQIKMDFANWHVMGLQCLTTLLVGIGTSMLVSGALPFIETIFRITTNFSWLEMTDLNHPLLKRMAFEAPGTYHHSQVVGRLAEAAADTIGANGAMCRVASYYHDIGKLKKPQYFIENINPEENPHDELTPTMSALIVTAHVKDGVDLGLKHKLNSEIIDVIREHHGTTLAGFFYHRALEQRAKIEALVDEGKANAEDLPTVEKKEFRYPGPKPQTRESAIISLADSIESAVRSIQKPTPNKIEQKINEITEARVKDGQLDDCELTLRDLRQIRKSFHSNLCSMMHNRVSYPVEGEESEAKKKRSKAERARENGETKTAETTPSPAGKKAPEGSSTPPLEVVEKPASGPKKKENSNVA